MRNRFASIQRQAFQTWNSETYRADPRLLCCSMWGEIRLNKVGSEQVRVASKLPCRTSSSI